MPDCPSPVVPKTVALVLTYNSGMMAVECVESLRASTLVGLQIRVVDNASTDNTAALLREHFQDLDLTVAGTNGGFGAGCNIGLRAAVEQGADYVVLINPDTRVAPDALEFWVQCAEREPKAGAIGAKTLSMDSMPDGQPRLLYAGAFAGALPLRQRVPGIERADTGKPSQPLEVDYVWGHGMLLRASALAQVGYFDEDYFMYCEDLDLCLRLKRAGYSLWCAPAALMWHDTPDGARAIHSELWRWRFKAQSMGLFHRKHYGGLRGRCLSFLTVCLEAAQLLRQGHWRALGHQLRASATSLNS